MRAFVSVLVASLALPAHADSQTANEPGSKPGNKPGNKPATGDGGVDATSDEIPPMSTSLWHGSAPSELPWLLLYAPEIALDLAFTPVAMLVGLVESYRLDKRVVDLLESEDGRVKVTPQVKLSFGDGLGLGAELGLRKLSEGRANFDAGGLARLDGDYELGAAYEHRVPRLEGRTLYASATHELDGNQPYFGIGGASAEADRRVLRSREAGVLFASDLSPLGSLPFAGIADLGLHWQELSAGEDGSRIPAGEAGDTVLPPPGFDDSHYYASVGLIGSYDTRDVGGKPSRGFYAGLSSRFLKAVDGAHLSALTLGADLEWYVPLLPHYRVLVISAGASSAFDPIPADDLPLLAYPFLGRSQHLRGYDRVRFRDRYAVWTGLEYRYPVYEYLATTAGLDALIFADAGTVFGEDALRIGTTRYSFGGGIRGAHETKLIFDMTIGWSPEGVELNLSAGRSL